VSSLDDLDADIEGDDENEAELDNTEDLVNGRDIAIVLCMLLVKSTTRIMKEAPTPNTLKMISKRLIVEWTTAKKMVFVDWQVR